MTPRVNNLRRVKHSPRLPYAVVAIVGLLLAGFGGVGAAQTTTTTAAGTTAANTGSECPQVVDTSKADFYPIQPSFSAGYEMWGQKLNSDTAGWAYVVTADFPYSNWTAWYTYNTQGVPLVKLSDTSIVPNVGSTNPFVVGNPILAPQRSFNIYMMPATTPASVVSSMQAAGKNVIVLPAVGSTPGVSIVSRSYWSFANDGMGNYDRFGYGGPTNTPFPRIDAYLTDPSTGELTATPVANCGAQSQLPKAVWYDGTSRKPIITFEAAPRPTAEQLKDIPRYMLEIGAGEGGSGEEFPPTPDPSQVQFYRNVASTSPYADVQSAPAPGSPPDACGGYVMANLPNNKVSLVHVPQVPSFPVYTGATNSTLNNAEAYNVQFYSVVSYGADKQLDKVGSVDNSQVGNTQIIQNADGSATIVLYPRNASSAQVKQINAIVKANSWNILKSGQLTPVAPNLLVIREKGQNQEWSNALSANKVTQGGPCPQSTDPTLPYPQDPPSAIVTQFNGMGLTAPSGVNCSIAEFTSGDCLGRLEQNLASTGQAWSSKSLTGPQQKGA